jgi:hypothetical protein
MQIHELTRKQLNEVDIVGPNGLIAGAKAAYGALKSGGVKDALRTITPGQGQGAFGTANLTQSDFAQRMQAIKNTAAMKEVAGLLQKQWMQASKTLPPAPAAEPEAEPETTTPPPAPNADVSVGKPNKPGLPGPAELDKFDQRVAQAMKQQQVTEQLTEAASLGQLTDWYIKSVVPRKLALYKDEYLKNPNIKTALQTILATADNPRGQAEAFQNLVAATSVESQVITAKNPELAAATGAGGAPTATKTLSGGASAARAEISNAARISPAQIDEIAKLTGTLGRVQAADSNTIAYLEALGFKTS